MTAGHARQLRAVLVSLGAIQVAMGLWATISPSGFYADFPLGRGWVETLPAYNEHLMRDVGALFLATGAVLLYAARHLERRLVWIALVSFLIFSVPHTTWHLFNLESVTAGDAIAMALSLLATVGLPLYGLWMVPQAGQH